MPEISVALPVSSAPETLGTAIECVRAQSLEPLDIVIVLNGSDSRTADIARQHAITDRRIRVIELEHQSLPAALNVALDAARFDLVARMDADDTCSPDRFARQFEFMSAHPEIAAVGTAFRRTLPDGSSAGTVIPATDPAEIRWRLLIENVLCHGSVVMRRSKVLAVGGYDEACLKAQDYDLWLRLSAFHPLANLPDVLYTHVARDRETLGIATDAQAAVVAERLIAAWASLPNRIVDDGRRRRLEHAVALAHQGGRFALHARAEIAELLTLEGPSRELLMAWLYAQSRVPEANQQTQDACRRGRLRERGTQLRRTGVTEVWLWGAGRHTHWVLDHRDDLGVNIAGVVDDHKARSRFRDFTVITPTELVASAHVLLSSDQYEHELWQASEACRARGVTVHRLYSESPRLGKARVA